MSSSSLTQHDLSILEKIKDPESASSSAAPLVIDDGLPRDPHVRDPEQYQHVVQIERGIISSLEATELQIAGLGGPGSSSGPANDDTNTNTDTNTTPLLAQYLDCVRRFDELIQEFPNYASARNNRAQSLRRIYGDGMLVKTAEGEAPGSGSGAGAGAGAGAPILDPGASDETLISVSKTILTDLATAISLLTPITSFAPLSSPSAKTLSQAHTQRGALYHQTAKRLSIKGSRLRIDESRREREWKVVDFEENASRDFLMGGRYGNEVARALAVSANPTAKLCGEMVKEAMRKEYAGADA